MGREGCIRRRSVRTLTPLLGCGVRGGPGLWGTEQSMTWGIPVGRSLPVAAVTSANYAGLPALLPSFLPSFRPSVHPAIISSFTSAVGIYHMSHSLLGVRSGILLGSESTIVASRSSLSPISWPPGDLAPRAVAQAAFCTYLPPSFPPRPLEPRWVPGTGRAGHPSLPCPDQTPPSEGPTSP